MAYLNFLLPYNYLGMPVTYQIFGIDSEGDEYSIGGHAFCIIKNGGGEFRILDAQAGTNIPLNHINDLLSVLPPKFSYVNDQQVTRAKIFAFMQSALYNEWHERTDNRNHFNVSPFAEHWYNTANNSVRNKFYYDIEFNNGNLDGNLDGNNDGNQEEYNGWYENGYNINNNRNTGGWNNNFGEGDNFGGLNRGNYHGDNEDYNEAYNED
jgi:hypothetical protein